MMGAGQTRPPVTHWLDAYTWAGRRGACGVTSENLSCERRDAALVTCPDCLTMIRGGYPSTPR